MEKVKSPLSHNIHKVQNPTIELFEFRSSTGAMS